ncbi:hypothetical protein E2C01_002079 [Portunus trituberculatus]|uniref:Uncharacterized protein n=1 Tax=Portunus trituberculatus TaxID=210409 RepID=A0A5B7CK07_PORTR|nr:hypothetical protein [Portunus trituberculatus]
MTFLDTINSWCFQHKQGGSGSNTLEWGNSTSPKLYTGIPNAVTHLKVPPEAGEECEESHCYSHQCEDIQVTLQPGCQTHRGKETHVVRHCWVHSAVVHSQTEEQEEGGGGIDGVCGNTPCQTLDDRTYKI